jgi:hypothetical protein
MECAASEHARDPSRYGADAFMHTAIAIQDQWLDIGPMTTKDVDEAIAKLKATAATTPPGELIL